MPIRAILTDIEGTTSSISFVKDVLFPYARRALPAFVAARGNEPGVRRWLDAVATENGGMCDDRMVVEVLQGWIDEDRKHTALKALQGMIWADGYRSADFAAHIYPDAAPALRAWKEAGLPLYVYSSGSVPAQRLFFGHSDAGDLTPLFSGWFDTEVGGKREAASYRHIADSIGSPAVGHPVPVRRRRGTRCRARSGAVHRAGRPARGLSAAAHRRSRTRPRTGGVLRRRSGRHA